MKKNTDFNKPDQPNENQENLENNAPDRIMRLNKFIAHCGICSRRKAAEYVKEGHVTVNGKTEINPAYEVQASDVITYKGKVVNKVEKMVYILMNKPKDVVTTLSDEHGRRTVIDIISNHVKERVFPVGRLDRATTGLLILTNDGDLTKRLSHPSHKVSKVYDVFLNRELSKKDFETIKNGVTLEDGEAMVDNLYYIDGKLKNEIGIELHIGKNRIVRRIFEHFGYGVKKLDRVYYGGLTKKNLARGHFRNLTEKEIIMLKHF